MAVYATPGRRRRTTVAIVAVALVIGLVIGAILGRATATSIDDQITKGRDGGRELVTALRVLPLEYRQALAGSSESKLIQDTVDRTVAQAGNALDDAPWLSGAQRRSTTSAVAQIRAAAQAKVAPKRFETVIARSTATIQSVFGLPASAG